MYNEDTIVAPATPCGRGGIGIVRVSGPKVYDCAKMIIGHLPKNRYAEYTSFKDSLGNIIDHGIAIYYKSPNSFTGEEVIEFQAHGGIFVVNFIIKSLLTIKGVRYAEPGEFSKRAFLNNKIDLVQAEAIADLISANSEQAAKSAINSLEGNFSKLINDLLEELINIRVYIEASIDFSDEEDVDFLTDGKILSRIESILDVIDKIKKQAKNGSIIREGMNIVIAGKPNAGKSSLLNNFSGKDSAIVTPIEGTTRDIIHEQINIDGLPVNMIDTAGIRETDNIAEQIGVDKAWAEINRSDCLLIVLDSTISDQENISIYKDITKNILESTHKCIVLNKYDLSNKSTITNLTDCPIFPISAITEYGIDKLKSFLKQLIGFTASEESGFSARTRHLESLDKAQIHILNAKKQLENSSSTEIIAEELKLSQKFLNEITGEFTSDDLLGKIFGSFCIGK